MGKKRQKKPVIFWMAIILLLVGLLILVLRNRLDIKSAPFSTSQATPTVYFSSSLEPISNNQVYVEMAVSSLTKKINVKKSDIEIIKVTEKNWNDTSLGCPEEEKLYTQVITPGFIIELFVNGKAYTYHAGLDKVVTCEER